MENGNGKWEWKMEKSLLFKLAYRSAPTRPTLYSSCPGNETKEKYSMQFLKFYILTTDPLDTLPIIDEFVDLSNRNHQLLGHLWR